MATRVIISVGFAYATRSARKRAGCGEAGESTVATFLRRFFVCGTVWLLAFPGTVLVVVPRLAPYHRHAVVSGAALILQSLALVSMLVLFLGVGDAGKSFLKASTIGAMGDLSASSSDGGSSSVGGSSLTSAVRRKVAVD